MLQQLSPDGAVYACRKPVGRARVSPVRPRPVCHKGRKAATTRLNVRGCYCIRRQASRARYSSLLQKEEAELEKLREQERIRSGKEMAAAKRQEEDLRLKRNLELRRIEKEEEERARARIRAKLGE